MTGDLEGWRWVAGCWGTQAWEGGFELVVPGDQSCLVQRVNNGTFKLHHHFHIVVVLDVVALDDSDFAIDDHEFGVECT